MRTAGRQPLIPAPSAGTEQNLPAAPGRAVDVPVVAASRLQVWSREGKLSLKLRSILTVSALVSKGMVDSSFQFHVVNARKNGVTKGEMAEILTHLAFYAGWPNAWAAFRVQLQRQLPLPGPHLAKQNVIVQFCELRGKRPQAVPACRLLNRKLYYGKIRRESQPVI